MRYQNVLRARLKQLLDEQQKSHSDLAAFAGYKRASSISEILSGRQNIPASRVDRFAEFFGISRMEFADESKLASGQIEAASTVANIREYQPALRSFTNTNDEPVTNVHPTDEPSGRSGGWRMADVERLQDDEAALLAGYRVAGSLSEAMQFLTSAWNKRHGTQEQPKPKTRKHLHRGRK
jgi:hypothetical protein